ncbi:MAG TPA: CBS domain-containing protein [Ktedonobacterales bacterium]|jgi:acetoin utilization protein AcuB
MLVKDIMVRDVVTVTENDTLEHATILLRQGRFRHLPVVEILPWPNDVRPGPLVYPPPRPPMAAIGVLSDRDLPGGRIGAVDAEHLKGRQVREVMHQPVITVSPTTPVEYAAKLMADNAIGCLPVVVEDAQDRLVGIITESDLFHALVRLVGAQEPSTRLRLMLHHGNAAQLAHALTIIAKHNGSIAGLIGEPTDERGRWPVMVRIRTIYPEPILRDLAAAGIEVEHPETL